MVIYEEKSTLGYNKATYCNVIKQSLNSQFPSYSPFLKLDFLNNKYMNYWIKALRR